MRAMILAAGLGTRLRPLTQTIPKPLVAVAGHPMIALPLHRIREAGIHDVAINLHYLGDQIREALGDGSAYGVRITYLEEHPILDTGGGIAAARTFLQGEPFVTLNADTAIDISLTDVIAFHQQHQSLATMVLRPDAEAARYGTIEIDGAQRIRRVLRYPPSDTISEPLTALMFAGTHVFSPEVFNYLPEGVYSITRDTYPQMLAAGEPLYGYIHTGYWRVLDTFPDLEAGRKELTGELQHRLLPALPHV